jgi:homoaconitase/3-isopropylmalate dehydratase large subunit
LSKPTNPKSRISYHQNRKKKEKKERKESGHQVDNAVMHQLFNTLAIDILKHLKKKKKTHFSTTKKHSVPTKTSPENPQLHGLLPKHKGLFRLSTKLSLPLTNTKQLV